MGEALPLVSAKLAGRIQAWEFVELLPEFWVQKADREGVEQAVGSAR